MRHRRKTKYFSRKYNARKALFRGLMVSLVENGRITTTVQKAKELRRHIEKAITVGKKEDLAARRLLMSRIPNEDVVDTIVTDLAKRFADRNGGYTRIIKIGRRPGDTAEMAFIEFVDYDWQAKPVAKETEAKGKKAKAASKEGDKAAAKAAAKARRARVAARNAKKKSVRKIQNKSRQEARA